jgi:PGF-CTERM protein
MDGRYSVRVVVLIVIVGTTLTTTGGVVAAGTATDAGSATVLTECTTIDEPGTYRLGGNLTASETDRCIEITADDVTFDGGGYTIANEGDRTDHGVIVQNASNVTVQNVAVSGMSWGVTFWGADEGTLEEARAAENFRAGVWVLESENVTVRGLIADGNVFDGARFHSSRNGRLLDSRLIDNGVGVSTGRSLDIGIRNNTLTDNQLGAQVMTTRDSRLIGNNVTGNEIGLVLSLTVGNNVTENRIRSGSDGVRLDGATDTEIRNNEITDVEFGVFLSDAKNNTVSDNRIQSTSVGVELTIGSDGNRVTRNVVDSDDVAIEVTISKNNTVSDNEMRASEGVSIAGDGENSITNNQLTRLEPATATPTESTDQDGETATSPGADPDSTDGNTQQEAPGFGAVAAILALLVVTLARRRW